MLDYPLIRRRFNQAALSDHRYFEVHDQIGRRLLGRLSYIHLQPKRVLHLGLRPGGLKPVLQKQYRKAQHVYCDFSAGMLAQQRPNWWQRDTRVCAEYDHLPFVNGAFDLVIAHLAVHWIKEPQQMIQECMRVLSPGGLFLFTTVGPDTFHELKSAGFSVHNFIDMHHWGDWLQQTGFEHPVVDMEYLTLRYSSFSTLLKERKASGTQAAKTSGGLVGSAAWQRRIAAYPRDTSGAWPLTIELVYGHAWRSEHAKRDHSDEVLVPVTAIRRPSDSAQ